MQETKSFAKIYKKLFPELLRLASDNQTVPQRIFEPLCKQIVHWLATSIKQEKEEVTVLLDSLLENAADKSNATLREHCASCIAEYFDWNIRHISKADLANNPQTIKSLIRKIQSFAIHPDPFKQLAAVLCFDKLLKSLRNEQALVDLYIMDITNSLLNALRLAEQSLCEATAKHLIDTIEKVIKYFRKTLIIPNDKRSGQKSFEEFTAKLFEKVSTSEDLCRHSAQQLWVVAAEDPNPSAWLHARLAKAQGNKNDILHFPLVDHIIYNQAQAATYMKAEKMNAEQFAAQIQCVCWLLKGKYAKWSELQVIFGKREIETLGVSIKNFIDYLSSSGDVGAKELRNPIIRIKLLAFANILELFGMLENSELNSFLQNVIEVSIEFFIDTLLIAGIEPQSLDLELCAIDKQLQQRVNNSIPLVLAKLLAINSKEKDSKYLLEKLEALYASGKITNLNGKEGNRHLLNIPAERLIQLCLGHLGVYRQMFKNRESKYVILSEKDASVGSFMEQKEILMKFIEELVEDCNPSNVQKAKVLLKYVLHLGVPYEKIEKWLLENFSLFQHCSDILFDYIVACWDDGVGHNIILSCNEKKTMLPVMFPVLRRLIDENKGSFLRVLYEDIPASWKLVAIDMDAITNELKIYQIVIGYARANFLNDLQSHLGEKLLTHCTERIQEYLKDTYAILIKKEALLLTAEVWNLKIGRVQGI